MIFAQVTEGVGMIAAGLASNPLAWVCALQFGAIAYLWLQLERERKNFGELLERERKTLGEQLATKETALVAALREDSKERMDLLQAVLPLSLKLSEAIADVERLAESLEGKE